MNTQDILEAGKLPPRAQLILDAVVKMERGRKLFEEGRTEFLHLTETKKPKNNNRPKNHVPGIKKVKLTAKKKVKANKVSTFHPEKRTDEELGEAIMKVVHDTGSATMTLLEKRLKLGGRRLVRALTPLLKDDKLEWAGEGVRGKPRFLRAPLGKKINGHGGGGTPHAKATVTRGPMPIDVTDEKIVQRAKKFLATHNWVNKPTLIEAIDLGPRTGGRFIEYAKKQGIIKEVMKKNNPAHKDPRAYGNEFAYYELS